MTSNVASVFLPWQAALLIRDDQQEHNPFA